MACDSCGEDHPPNDCPKRGQNPTDSNPREQLEERTDPPRLRVLLVASALYLVIALVSLAMKNVVFAIVTGGVGFFLLRSMPIAVGSAIVLSSIGVVTNGVVLAAVLGYVQVLIDRSAVGSHFVELAVLQIVLHVAVLALLLSPPSRKLLREAKARPARSG